MAVFADRPVSPRPAASRTRHASRVAATLGLGLGTLAGLGLLAQGSVLFGAGALLAASTHFLPWWVLLAIALVLLVNTQMLYSGMDAKLVGMLMATILLMQLFGPLATQTAIKGFGEATRLSSSGKTGAPAENNGGTS